MSDPLHDAARADSLKRDPLYGLEADQRAAIEGHIRAGKANQKSEIQALRRQLSQMDRELSDRDMRIAAMSYYQEIPRAAKPITGGSGKHPSGQATAVFLLSDWHIEEAVDPKAVGGLNAYSVDIAWTRAKQCAKSIVWLLEAKRHEAKIEDVVVALLGDFITGLVPTSDSSLLREVGPARAAALAQEMLGEVLRYVAKEAGARRILVPCVGGNHGRLTPKPVHSRSAQWNLEDYMLGNLANEFRGEKQYEFLGTDDFAVLLDVQGTRIRFQHGDGIRYGGGVGGIAIPINKARARMNETPDQHADLDCMGHFHQSYDGGTFVVNGSLIGMTGYARKGRFAYQPPEQMGFLVRPQNPKAAPGSRGKVDTFRVFVT